MWHCGKRIRIIFPNSERGLGSEIICRSVRLREFELLRQAILLTYINNIFPKAFQYPACRQLSVADLANYLRLINELAKAYFLAPNLQDGIKQYLRLNGYTTEELFEVSSFNLIFLDVAPDANSV